MNGSGLPRGRSAWLVAAIGTVALLLCVALGRDAPAQAWVGYLAAYLFWLGLALGALGLAMIHVLTGGDWGERLRPQLAATMRTLPLLAVALLPLLIGADALFPWLRHAPVDAARFARQTWYLNEPFLLARAVAFMALWLVLAWAMAHRLDRAAALDAAPSPEAGSRPEQRSAGSALVIIGLLVYAISASLFGVDWVMALEPRWHSSVFGMTFISLQLLGGLAWSVWAALGPADRDRGAAPADRVAAQGLGDLGSLLMALLLLSAYLAFMDYLTAWTGDLPSETVWYIPRTLTSWRWLAALVTGFGLLLPFALLLSRRIKRSVRGLRLVAALLLAAEFGFVLWLVLPSLRPAGVWFSAVDALAFVGLGALWWSVFASARRMPSGRAARQPLEAAT